MAQFGSQEGALLPQCISKADDLTEYVVEGPQKTVFLEKYNGQRDPVLVITSDKVSEDSRRAND